VEHHGVLACGLHYLVRNAVLEASYVLAKVLLQSLQLRGLPAQRCAPLERLACGLAPSLAEHLPFSGHRQRCARKAQNLRVFNSADFQGVLPPEVGGDPRGRYGGGPDLVTRHEQLQRVMTFPTQKEVALPGEDQAHGVPIIDLRNSMRSAAARKKLREHFAGTGALAAGTPE
jgi:hypothetical protein